MVNPSIFLPESVSEFDGTDSDDEEEKQKKKRLKNVKNKTKSKGSKQKPNDDTIKAIKK